MTAGLVSNVIGSIAAWRQIWEPNEALQRETLQNKAGVRFAKAVATFAYQYGMLQSFLRQPPFAPPTQKPVATQEPVTEVKSVAGVAVVVPSLVLDIKHLTKLRRTIGCIQAQSLSPAFVFVVDDGSPLPIESQLSKRDLQGVTILRSERNQGPAAARNKGLQAAREAGIKYVCFTDADCLPKPNWLQSLVQHFEEHPDDDLLGGITQSLDGSTYVDLFHDVFGTLNGRVLPDKTLLYAPTCNMGIRMRSVTGNFSTAFPDAAFEDIDFCIKARKSGATLRHVEARVLHDYDSSIGGLFKQFARYGRSQHVMLRNHPYYQGWLMETKGIPALRLFAL